MSKEEGVELFASAPCYRAQGLSSRSKERSQLKAQ